MYRTYVLDKCTKIAREIATESAAIAAESAAIWVRYMGTVRSMGTVHGYGTWVRYGTWVSTWVRYMGTWATTSTVMLQHQREVLTYLLLYLS